MGLFTRNKKDDKDKAKDNVAEEAQVTTDETVDTKNDIVRRKVVIIGGGYGGMAAAVELDRSPFYRVTVIDKNGFFTHSIAALRSASQADWASNIVIDNTKVMTHGKVVIGNVISIDTTNKQVHTADNVHYDYDYCIVATGNNTPFPGKSPVYNASQARLLYNQLYMDVMRAKNIVVVGGGPVGVELTGEIACKYNTTSALRKDITLIHSGARLLDSFPNIRSKVGNELNKILTKQLHVNVILNDRAELPELPAGQLYYTGQTTVALKNNTVEPIQADLVIVCVSGRANSNFLQKILPTDAFDANGHVIVNQQLQVSNISDGSVYAIGDVASFQPGWAYYATEQGKFAARQLIRLAQNKSHRKASKQSNVMLVPLGDKYGYGQLPVMSLTIGSTLVSMIKGSDLFVSKQKQQLNIRY